MPDATIYRDPCVHIVVRNFLGDVLKEKILDGLKPLLPHMGKVYQQDPDEVDRSHDEDGKKGVWAYPFFKENPALDDSCLSLFESQIWTLKLRAAFRETGDMLFQSYNFTNSSEILLSRYAMKTKTYPFEDDFLILFPCKATHKVTPTKQERYSLQYWAECRADRPQKSPYA